MSETKMQKNMKDYANTLRKYDAVGTIPVPAITLSRNREFIQSIDQSIIEWAMHGYIHTDYKKLDAEEFNLHIKNGVKIFKENGLYLYGFRAPYLSMGTDGFDILKKNSLLYDSSHSYLSSVMSEEEFRKEPVKKIVDYYGANNSAGLEIVNEITEIPVWLPDDEILVDRLGMSPKNISKCWLSMAEEAMRTDGILVLQLHPERFQICKEALVSVLKWGNENDAEFLKLSDIAKEARLNSKSFKGQEHPVIAITGDLDIMSIRDLKAMNSFKIGEEGFT